MINPFIQYIGIWYAREDEPMLVSIMNQISKWCSNYIEKEIRNKYERSIFLKGGTWIKAFLASDGMRGQKCSTSFLINPEHIDENIINCAIRPITAIGARDIWVIDSSDEEELWRRLLWHRMSYDDWRQKEMQKMCNNECVSDGKCNHNEECYEDSFLTREQVDSYVDNLIRMARAAERRKICQMVKDNNGSIEGKDGIVVTTQEDFENILAETETNAIRKFAIWLRNCDYLNECHVFHSDVDYTQPTVNEVLNEYEREKNKS